MYLDWSERRVGLALVLLLAVVLSGSLAGASGQRGMVLTEKSLEQFHTLTARQTLARQGLHYVGSTDRWHAFMKVETSASRGMPWSHLSTFKVDASQIRVVNGWSLRFGRYVAAGDCPVARVAAGAPDRVWVPEGDDVQRRCLRGDTDF